MCIHCTALFCVLCVTMSMCNHAYSSVIRSLIHYQLYVSQFDLSGSQQYTIYIITFTCLLQTHKQLNPKCLFCQLQASFDGHISLFCFWSYFFPSKIIYYLMTFSIFEFFSSMEAWAHFRKMYQIQIFQFSVLFFSKLSLKFLGHKAS